MQGDFCRPVSFHMFCEQVMDLMNNNRQKLLKEYQVQIISKTKYLLFDSLIGLRKKRKSIKLTFEFRSFQDLKDSMENHSPATSKENSSNGYACACLIIWVFFSQCTEVLLSVGNLSKIPLRCFFYHLPLSWTTLSSWTLIYR